ncbi:MAG: hypothetical protein JW959_08750 [Pirellulales bacterium]|nr:hypothetical protein [Pirellulales bacterium]
MSEKTDRRCFLAKTALGAGGILAAGGSIEEDALLAAIETGAAGNDKPKTDIPPGALEQGKIRGVSISRLVLGGNLIGGWAHARDLMYVSKLFKSYNTEAKIFETLEISLACGINTIQIAPAAWDPVLKFNRNRSEKIQTIVCAAVSADKNRMEEEIKRLVGQGATLVYLHGGDADKYVRDGGDIELFGWAIDKIKAQGVPAGVGSHSLKIPVACEKNKLDPDFYVKTLHIDRYWSATPEASREEWEWLKREPTDHNRGNDNLWCFDAEETADFMEKVEKPWVAFKVMAAGAIRPNVAFSYAFRKGADFVLAGMFDFQVEQDVKIAARCISKFKERKRPWRG